MIPAGYVLLVVFAFSLGTVDASFGMGYGTLLAPMLLLAGFDPLQVVPAVLISQLAGDFLAAFFHHRIENVDFSIGSKHLKVALTLAILGLISSVIAVLVAVSLPSHYLSLYIGLSTAILGVFIIAARSKSFGFSWVRILLLGGLASFNKGLTGGGYGPIITVGQILTGIDAKAAIGITALAEGVTCSVAALSFFFFRQNMDWLLPILLSIGVAISSPVAALIVRKVDSKFMKSAIGVSTFVVGLVTLMKVFQF